jgi:hypothetical protein
MRPTTSVEGYLDDVEAVSLVDRRSPHHIIEGERLCKGLRAADDATMMINVVTGGTHGFKKHGSILPYNLVRLYGM